MALADILNPGDQPCIGHPAQPLVSGPSHPDAVLVLPAHRPLEVDAPRVAARVEVEGSKRYLDFDRPPDRAAVYTRVPDAVPLAVVDPAAHQRVAHETRRI